MQPIELPIINRAGSDRPLAVDPQNVKLAIEIRTQEEQNSGEKAEKTGWRRYAGIFLAITSSFFYSLTIVVAKMMEDYHPLNLTVWRFMGILVPAVPITLYYKYVKRVAVCDAVWPLKDREKMINFFGTHVRGVLLFGLIFLSFWALKYLTVADMAVISYSGPVFVMMLAFLMLDEKCGIVPVVVTILTCLGVFVILRPPLFTGEKSFSPDTLTGVSLGVISMVLFAFLVTLVRRTRKVHFSYMLLASGVWGVSESLIISVALGIFEFPRGIQASIFAYCVIPVLAFITQFTMILALKYESAGPVSLVRACEVIYAFIWQALFLHQYPDIFSIIGAVIIISGVVILTVRKWLMSLPKENGTRLRFSWLLR